MENLQNCLSAVVEHRVKPDNDTLYRLIATLRSCYVDEKAAL